MTDKFPVATAPDMKEETKNYQPPSGHDRHLSDSERAHSGVPGSKVRHGADALGMVKAPRHSHADDKNL